LCNIVAFSDYENVEKHYVSQFNAKVNSYSLSTHEAMTLMSMVTCVVSYVQPDELMTRRLQCCVRVIQQVKQQFATASVSIYRQQLEVQIVHSPYLFTMCV
jgi:hypothetical protein